MSSLPKIYLHKMQCFQEFYCSKLKLLISAINDPVDLKSKENRGHVNIELNLVKANMQDHKIKARTRERKTSYVHHLYKEN
jgi:hypothetical protein